MKKLLFTNLIVFSAAFLGNAMPSPTHFFGDIAGKLIGEWNCLDHKDEWVRIYRKDGKLLIEKHFVDLFTKKNTQEEYELFTSSNGETYAYKAHIGGNRSVMYWPEHDKMSIDGQGTFERKKQAK